MINFLLFTFILGYLTGGFILNLIYLKAFHLFGIPGSRQWVSLIWRLLLSPVFWPFIVMYDLHTGDDPEKDSQ